jgi:sulfide:quinone oxidoreductase
MMSARILIAGGGVAGLEAAVALRELAGERVEVEICAPRREFLYRPFAVGEPYDASHVLRYDLEGLARRAGAGFRLTSISAVDGGRRLATTPDGETSAYDYLVVASGVKLLWSVPGATMFWGIPDESDAANVVSRLGTSELGRLVFAMPAGHSWSLPLYELALLAGSRQRGPAFAAKSTRLTVVTPEDSPLGVFGRQVSEDVGRLFEERGIEVMTGTHPVRFEDGRLIVAPGEPIEADAVISLPRMEGRRIAGVPHDEEGFVPIDEHCRVIGLERAFAAGDVAAFPVKQGGIASQQADAVAEAIAAELGGDVDPQPFDPVLRGVLWTGEGPRYLYGRPTGGHGETSSLSMEPPWPEQEGKILSRYLSDFLAAA